MPVEEQVSRERVQVPQGSPNVLLAQLTPPALPAC